MYLFSSRKVAFSLIFLLIISLLAGCSGGKSTDTGSTLSSNNGGEKVESVRVGMLLPLTGPVAPLGLMSKSACEIALEEINSAGGIKSMGGAKLEFVYADSQGQPQIGVSETERLITVEKVDLMNGAYQSGVTLPATEVAERYKKIWLCDSASEDEITERGFKYLFRTSETSGMRVQFQIKYLDEIIKKSGEDAKTVALIYENTAFGQGVYKNWLKYLPDTDLEIVMEEAYPASSSDLSAVVSKTISLNPDIVLMCSYVNDAALLINGFAEQKFEPMAFVGTAAGFMDPKLVELCGKNILNYYDMGGVMNFPGTDELKANFKEKYGMELSFDGMLSYGGVYAIYEALEIAGTTDSEILRETFANLDLTKGNITRYTPHLYFDEKGQFPEPPLAFFQFREENGEVTRKAVYPEEYADGPEWSPIFPAYGK